MTDRLPNNSNRSIELVDGNILNITTQDNSSSFEITAESLEKIMCLYKDRGISYSDISFFTIHNGTQELLSQLKTDFISGIATDSIEARTAQFGSNAIIRKQIPSLWSYIKDALEDVMIRILIISAIIQIILGITMSDHPKTEWIDGASIILAVIVVVGVTGITNRNKALKFNELYSKSQDTMKYKVIRQGKMIEIKESELVVGDLFHISYGDCIPADAILIDGRMKIDESPLTGESAAIKKETYEKCLSIINEKKDASLDEEKISNEIIPSPLILSGTYCIEGNGKAIVLSVGIHSQKGIISRTIDNAKEDKKTPLEMKIDNLAKYIGYIGLSTAILMFIFLTLNTYRHYVSLKKANQKAFQLQELLRAYNSNNQDSNKIKNIPLPSNISRIIIGDLLNNIIICISIIVVAIPEGLPLAVTLSLAFSVKTMMEKKNLIRKIEACETMGEANYICTDKTGTLTKNDLKVITLITGDKQINQMVYDQPFKNPYDEFFIMDLSTAIENNLQAQDTKNKTDQAFNDFLLWINDTSTNNTEKHNDNMNETDVYYKKVFNFDSKRKRMTTLVYDESLPTKYRLYTKGCGENIKSYCSSYLDPSANEVLSIGDNIGELSDMIDQINKQQIRTLYVCYKDITKEEFDNWEKSTEQNENDILIDQYDLVLLAICGLRDSLRDGIAESVDKCLRASVSVIMVTGDNIITATSIAKECHIIKEDINQNQENITIKQVVNQEEITETYLTDLINSSPVAINGNEFYSAIGGLLCKTCQSDTSQCKCAMTESEVSLLRPNNQHQEIKVRKEVIKYKNNFITLLNSVKVIARAQPIHKYALVLGLKELGNVVAVTGDGTNDALALSKSDVGFAMMSGTDISKEASDIILMNNNFASIVTAIIFGRGIYDNIKKFLQFQLTVNLCACLFFLLGSLFTCQSPLTPIQMLWVNLIMDSLGSLALATESPYDELLYRKPIKKDESIISRKMIKHIIFQALMQLFILLLIYFLAPLFIKEQDLIRLAETSIIQSCYEGLPGNATNPSLILTGLTSKWSADILLQKTSNAELCGKYSLRPNLEGALIEYQSSNGNTVHMTMVFNIFVMYTLFNQFNCRVIDDNRNISSRLRQNYMFLIIVITEVLLQVLIIEYGKGLFNVAKNGLTIYQWIICLLFSGIAFIWSYIIKKIPIAV